jgi:hypothetical protein
MLSGNASSAALHALALEPEAAVDLAAEVLARQQVVLGVLLARLAVHELPVRGLEVGRDPADAALHRHELRSGKRWHTPPKIRSAMQCTFCMKIIDDTRAKFARVPRPSLSTNSGERSPPPMWKLIGTPVSCTAAQNGSQWLGRERRLAPRLGLRRREHGAVALRDRALHLLHALADVPERHRGHRDQPVRIGAAPVDRKSL